jgi:ssDNA-binding Zn-finger/Zn-ribbon topoisomerase 1
MQHSMLRKQKINLDRVKAPHDTVCPKCGYEISLDKLRRIDLRNVECPECRERFVPEKSGLARQ